MSPLVPRRSLFSLQPSAFLQAATVTWIGGSGDWNTAANWSSAPALPGHDDEVLIDVPDLIAVTHASGTHTVRSLLGQEAASR